MPGSVDLLNGTAAQGWARHPVHAAYAMTVHAIAGGRVIASTLADCFTRDDGLPGYALAFQAVVDPQQVYILLGETDEVLLHPSPPPAPRIWTVEDLIAAPMTRRAWVNGACHIEAAQAGLRAETIIDLFCRDLLGRPAGPVVIATALAALDEGGYDAVRRMLLTSSEYKYRRIHADRAPGAIFSQDVVMLAAAGDFATEHVRAAVVTAVSAAPLLALEAEDFVTACYRQILRKEPDRAGMAHYVRQLAGGMSKVAIIRHLGGEFETISAGITIVDLPAED